MQKVKGLEATLRRQKNSQDSVIIHYDLSCPSPTARLKQRSQGLSGSGFRLESPKKTNEKWMAVSAIRCQARLQSKQRIFLDETVPGRRSSESTTFVSCDTGFWLVRSNCILNPTDTDQATFRRTLESTSPSGELETELLQFMDIGEAPLVVLE